MRQSTPPHYARVVNSQPNPNVSYKDKRINWTNCVNASSNNNSSKPVGSATSKYTKTANYTTQSSTNKKTGKKVTKQVISSYTYKKPWTVTCHDYGLNIPNNAYVHNVTFKVRMKCTSGLNVRVPKAGFYIYHGTKAVNDNLDAIKGWKDGTYYHSPNEKLSTSWKDVTYTISGYDWNRRGYPTNRLNDAILGIDLMFYDADTSKASGTVYIDYATITVDYEIPEYQFNVTPQGTSLNNPYNCYTGKEFVLFLQYSNLSHVSGDSDSVIEFDLPSGTKINRDVIQTVSNGFNFYGVNNFSTSTNSNGTTHCRWVVERGASKINRLSIPLVSTTTGEKEINFSGASNATFYYYPSINRDIDVGTVQVSSGEVRKGVTSCLHINSKVNSYDETVKYNILLDSSTTSNINNTLVISDNKHVKVTLDENNTSYGVKIKEVTDNSVSFTVPTNQSDVDIAFDVCFIPKYTGDKTAKVWIDGYNESTVNYPYKSLNPYTYVFTNKAKEGDYCNFVLNKLFINVHSHRVATSTEIGAYVLNCSVDEMDSTMEFGDCSVTAYKWDKINYIGCVPLEQTHFDPKSNFKDSLLDETFKNKTYMGKKGEIDEDIDLNIRLRPHQVTTIQGLIKMDKPVPINANHKCFEGDALNHRGWIELYGIQAEKTNPHWYKCSIDQKYITHDIHTKFNITRGLRSFDGTMPNLLTQTLSIADNLSKATDLFNIDTDGTFMYDSEADAGTNNIFSLDDGQHLRIKSLQPVTSNSRIAVTWYSNKLKEDRENSVSRIFRLRDKNTNNVVFEYEYFDFKFEDSDYIYCSTQGRTLNNNLGYDEWNNTRVDLRSVVEIEPNGSETETENEYELVYDEYSEEEYYDEDSEDNESESAYTENTVDLSQYSENIDYGSTLIFEINTNNLIVTDTGFNGKEAYKDDFELINGEYYFEIEWVNNNQDGMTEDVLSFIGIDLQDTMLDATYSSQYKDLIISPFPIPNKEIVFTRNSEEGTIYYLRNDNQPFKYLLEPYYQYHCGTDLCNYEGSSIFDLNNSYTRFYIQNGLVRMGFNRFNGQIYLSKYDPSSQQYINTNYFHMSQDTKFSISSIDDDKIIVLAGDTTKFTIWRGHPYIMVENPTEIINIDSRFNRAYGDKVNGQSYEFPIIWDFLNTDNLLNACVGGLNTLDGDCVSVDDEDSDVVTETSITLVLPDTIYALEDVELGVTGLTGEVIHYIVDGKEVGTAIAPAKLTYQFESEGEHTIQAVFAGTNTLGISYTDKTVVKVEQKKAPTNLPEGATNNTISDSQPNLSGSFNLKILSAPSSFTYGDKQEITMQLLRGNTGVRDLIVERQTPNSTLTMHTGVNGIFTIPNDEKYLPGTYKWGARFYDWHNDDGDVGTVIVEKFKTIKINKANANLTTNAKDGKVSKGKKFYLYFRNYKGNALKNISFTYKIGSGANKSAKTNANGNWSHTFTKKGTYKVKVMWGGNTIHNKIEKTFTIVVK